MTEHEAQTRAEAAAQTYFSDHLIGKLASLPAIEVAKRALLTYDADREHLNWYGPIDDSGPAVRRGKSRWV